MTSHKQMNILTGKMFDVQIILVFSRTKTGKNIFNEYLFNQIKT